MTRLFKKAIYGVLWGCCALIVIGAVYLVAVRPAPTCSDGIKNQREESIDCGGPCESCEVKNLSPIRILRHATAFSTSDGSAVLLAVVLNPNAGYAVANFSYRFVLTDSAGAVLETIDGSDRLFASEARYLFAGRVQTPANRIARVDLVVGDPQWKPRRETTRPEVEVLSGFETLIRDSAIFIRGSVRNQSTLPADSVRVTAVLLDRSGSEIFAGQGWVTNLAGTSEAPFLVQFPVDEALALRVDPGVTRLFVAVQ